MLGWFKKKKNKKKEEVKSQIEQPSTSPSDLVVGEIIEPQVSDSPQVLENIEVESGIEHPIHQDTHDEQLIIEETEPPSQTELPIVAEKKDVIDDEDYKEDSIVDEGSDPPNNQTSQKSGLFSRLSERLSKTKETFTYQMDALFLGKKEIDNNLLDDLEEILITADLGVSTTQELLEEARKKINRKELANPDSLKELLKTQIKSYIQSNVDDGTMVMPEKGPFVIMVIGVNGVGKTTTIGKIAHKFISAGKSVMLVAGDTFRAAAVSQLQIWGERNNVPVVAHKEGADPSSVAFDGIGIALKDNIDVVLVDTAGRLHTKSNLMEELKKIKRVMNKKLKGAPHEILLTIDATTGQNGISQALLFDDTVGVTGLALTKLDGTSKGGIVANISRELDIPIRFIGIGEQVDDLRDFNADDFVDALFQSKKR